MNATSVALAIITIFLWGLAPLPEKIGLEKIAPLTGVLIRTTTIFAILMTGAIIVKFTIGKEIGGESEITAKGVFLIALGGILASLMGQITFYYSLKYGNASTVVPIASTYPLVTFIVSILFLKEKFSLTKAGGLMFILTGIFLLSRGVTSTPE